MQAVILAVLFSLTALRPAIAQSANEVRAVQFGLSQVERYRPGPEDGILGPRTRAAIEAYARSRAVEPLFWPVATHMIQLVSWRRPWTEEVDSAVRTALKRASLNGRPPVIRDRRLFDVSGRQSACLMIRTTEGPRWLHFDLARVSGVSATDGRPVSVLMATGPASLPARTSQLWCSLGYVSGATEFHWK